MKITVLTYLDSEDENSKEYDAVVPQVARALRSLGHRVSVLGAHGDVKRLIAGLSRRRPDLVFNLMEMFAENVFGDIPVAGLLDLLGLKYTGSGPGELYLSQDKGLTKKLLAFEEILYPRFAVFSRQQAFETGGNLRMPLFVKPLRSDSSLGIGGKSLVNDAVALMERVNAIRKELTRLWPKSSSKAASSTWECSETASPRRCPRSRWILPDFPRGCPRCSTARRNGTSGARNTRGPNRFWPICPTSYGLASRRWRSMPSALFG
jgi:hypothetical protein